MPDQPIHIADAIEAGLKHQDVREVTTRYLAPDGPVHQACALGCALVGLVGDPAKAHALLAARDSSLTAMREIQRLTHLDEEPLQWIEDRHVYGKVPASVIAKKARTQFPDAMVYLTEVRSD